MPEWVNNPPQLEEDYAGRGRSFGEHICQNYDILYSCPSYRTWRLEGRKLRKDTVFEYFHLAENPEEDEQYRYAGQDPGHENLD